MLQARRLLEVARRDRDLRPGIDRSADSQDLEDRRLGRLANANLELVRSPWQSQDRLRTVLGRRLGDDGHDTHLVGLLRDAGVGEVLPTLLGAGRVAETHRRDGDDRGGHADLHVGLSGDALNENERKEQRNDETASLHGVSLSVAKLPSNTLAHI